MLPLSCTIITKNEGDRIERTLISLSNIVDEIIVIDSGSTDDTEAICSRYKTRFIHNDWVGFGPQKRFAEDQAKHNWILNLDADEVLTEDLIEEITSLREADKPKFNGYRFKQVSVYPHHQQPRLYADYHNFIRLYDRTKMRFHDSLVHDVVDPKGQEIGQLQGTCLHFSFRSLAHIKSKLDSYTTLQAKEIKKPIWILLLRIPIEYPVAFIKFYLLRRHITGGLFGLRLSHIMAKSKVNRLWKILQAQFSSRTA